MKLGKYIDNIFYDHDSSHNKKKNAKNRASRLRKRGFLARVVQNESSKRYEVLSHRKSIVTGIRLNRAIIK